MAGRVVGMAVQRHWVLKGVRGVQGRVRGRGRGPGVGVPGRRDVLGSCGGGSGRGQGEAEGQWGHWNLAAESAQSRGGLSAHE